MRGAATEDYFQRATGGIHWGAMSLPVAEMDAVMSAMAGLDLTPPPEARITISEPVILAKLRRLHAAAGRLAGEYRALLGELLSTARRRPPS